MWTTSDPQRNSLIGDTVGWGNGGGTTPIQRHADEGLGREEPLQVVASDGDRWAGLEVGFIRRVLRKRGPAKEFARARLFMIS